ncbi:NO signaling/Golgi transport ligand-binding domain-containing protein [Naematelia encephala]|uniref:Trafficking protein particle complex subunit BET3 n=1 Tax=Naematelia encephala TaxID=71784 RepID=A0A1Y2B4M1_9TREE|nr:NO signaling/Golgi transport ligand-binding domain-containing protein [Naematelia encephala]
MSSGSKQYKAIGEDVWKRTDKVNAELFTLTYGALVVQLIKDYEDYAQVNKQLEKMGYNIGTRLIEDFLARTGLQRCSTFGETAEVVSKVAFKTFLNITPTISFPAPSTIPPAAPLTTTTTTQQQTSSSAIPLPFPSEFILVFDENPLSEFAELPRDAREGGLWFSNVLCGVIRGSLEMVSGFHFFLSDL